MVRVRRLKNKMDRPNIEYLRALLKPSKDKFHCSNCRTDDEQERTQSFMNYAEDLLNYIKFLEKQPTIESYLKTHLA
jgi:hypothetical protein